MFGFFIAEHYGAMKQQIAKISLKSISLVVLVSTIYFAVVYAYVPALLTAPVYRVTLLAYRAVLLSTPHLFLLEAQHKLGRAARILVAVSRKNR